MEQNNNTQIQENNVGPEIKDSKMKKFWKDGLEFVKYAIIALAIVIPIRMFIAQPFIVSGSSMVPTFHDTDYLIVDEISYIVGQPHRDDVIVFHFPVDKSKYLIKRIIGLPGETVTIVNGIVSVTSPDGKVTTVQKEPYINEPFHTTHTYVLKADEYFVMGDNRNNSSDSRVWGILPRKNIVGRAFLRLLPISHIDYLPGAFTQ